MKILKGMIYKKVDHNNVSSLYVNGTRVVEFFEQFNKRKINVCWVTSTDRILKAKDFVDIAVNSANGYTDAEFSEYYSELTGHLWTDQEAKVGGHDMLELLGSLVDSYLYLIASTKEIDLLKLEEV